MKENVELGSCGSSLVIHEENRLSDLSVSREEWSDEGIGSIRMCEAIPVVCQGVSFVECSSVDLSYLVSTFPGLTWLRWFGWYQSCLGR